MDTPKDKQAGLISTAVTAGEFLAQLSPPMGRSKSNIVVPAGISVTMDHTFVNVIGRGEVSLSSFSSQSSGRRDTGYDGKVDRLVSRLQERPEAGSD